MTIDPAVIFKTKSDAALPPMGPSSPWPRRQPAVDGDDSKTGSTPGSSRRPEFVDSSLHPVVADALAGISPAGRQAPATVENTFEILDVALRSTFDGDDMLHARLVRLETEIARLTAKVAEAQAKLNEVSFVQERLQIERRGPPGLAGPRGADGPRGETGLRGERGEPGKPAPAVIEWRPDPEAFTIQAVLSDGSTGPMIALRSLFEAYDAAVSLIEDRDLTEAAQTARALAEQEIEASRWASR
jgi:hypothetical protein